MSLAAQKRGPELVIFADREIDLSNAERFEERLDAARSRTRRSVSTSPSVSSSTRAGCDSCCIRPGTCARRAVSCPSIS